MSGPDVFHYIAIGFLIGDGFIAAHWVHALILKERAEWVSTPRRTPEQRRQDRRQRLRELLIVWGICAVVMLGLFGWLAFDLWRSGATWDELGSGGISEGEGFYANSHLLRRLGADDHESGSTVWEDDASAGFVLPGCKAALTNQINRPLTDQVDGSSLAGMCLGYIRAIGMFTATPGVPVCALTSRASPLRRWSGS